MIMGIQPFTIAVADDVLADLRRRLAATRWPDEVDDAGWDYGANLAYLKGLVAYWRDGFDWRAQEATLNQYAQYRADIDGVGVHFVHERGRGPHPLPLIITHGWPSSFAQMLKIVPLLTDPARYGGDPADAFDVVVPSLPGFGFSDRPRARGMNGQRIATLWARLMADTLGYRRFAAAGGTSAARSRGGWRWRTPTWSSACTSPTSAIPRPIGPTSPPPSGATWTPSGTGPRARAPT